MHQYLNIIDGNISNTILSNLKLRNTKSIEKKLATLFYVTLLICITTFVVIDSVDGVDIQVNRQYRNKDATLATRKQRRPGLHGTGLYQIEL